MAAKPTPGGSDGTYGTELNEFLDVSLASDGKIIDGAVFSTSAAPTVDAGAANKKYVDDTVDASFGSTMAGGFTELTTSTSSFSKTITYPNGLIHHFGYDNNPSDFTIDISGASFTAVYKASGCGYDDNQTTADRFLFINILTTTSIAFGGGVAASNYDGIFYEVWGR